MRGIGDAKGSNRLSNTGGISGVTGTNSRAAEHGQLAKKWRRIERQIAAERKQAAKKQEVSSE